MRGRRSSRSAVAHFAVSGIVATLVIGVLTVAVSRHIGTDQAINDAKHITMLAGQGIVGPHIGDAVIEGDRAALRRLDRVVRSRVLRHGLVRVKVWSREGRVVYSDEPRLIGRQFTLDADERAAIVSGEVRAEVSEPAGPENFYEAAEAKLLEVYVPIHDRAGRRLTMEAYQRYAAVSASGRKLWQAFAPALLGGLVLLLLVTLPLARSLARRVNAAQREREALLRRALDASQTERRQIAAELHDGAVQDLVGASYGLEAEADRLADEGHTTAGAAVRQAAAVTRAGARALRALLIGIYPPSLHDAGLAAVLRDLARTYSSRGIATSLEMSDEIVCDEPTEQLLFRCAQEMLRNTHKHAGALSARISLQRAGDGVVMEVQDDGRGFDPALLDKRSREGHFGLTLLRDLIAEAGGRLDVHSAPHEGTTVRVALPDAAAAPSTSLERSVALHR
jgi:two-component system, NarL family, sensor kinase